jgi:hypothetical protein
MVLRDITDSELFLAFLSLLSLINGTIMPTISSNVYSDKGFLHLSVAFTTSTFALEDLAAIVIVTWEGV